MASHYESLQGLVGRGIFDSEPIGEYVGYISMRARHFTSPIGSGKTMDAFGLSPDMFYVYIGGFVRRAIEHEKVLPLDELVCVEDEDSAVFLENHPGTERTIIATTYYGLPGNQSSNGYLISGALRFIKDIGECIIFSPLWVYVAFIKDGSIKQPNREETLAGAHDLVNAVTAALEQLAYMERQGMLRGVKQIG